MDVVYERLQAEGLQRTYVQKVLLPEWWQDSAAATKSGFLHGVSFIAQRAGIQIAPLIQQNQSIQSRDFGLVKFKKPQNVASSQIKWAKNIAASAAQLVAGLMRQPFVNPGMTAAELRRKMAQAGSTVVTLKSLLDLSWSHGIPVLYAGHLPPGFRRMDGMAARIEGRPVIVTSKKESSDAWLAFIIAHEFGHICSGHVTNGVVVDEAIDGKDGDPEEAQANSFAVELLTGSPSTNYDLGTFIPTLLKSKGERIASAKNVDPGVVILNHAFHRAQGGEWGMVKKALKLLDGDANAPRAICERMLKELDLKGLDDDQREYLERLSTPATPAVS